MKTPFVGLLLLPALALGQVPCTQVPGSLFHASGQIFPKGLPDDVRLAGARSTLGVLVPRLPEGHTLYLVRGEKRAGEYWLPAPKDHPFPHQPMFTLTQDGELTVLHWLDFVAIYAGPTLIGSLSAPALAGASLTASRSRLYWGPNPWGGLPRAPREGSSLGKDEEPPALLMSSELDGTDQTVLLRLDRSRVRDRKSAWDQELEPVIRSDGKLWLVGVYSGEILLATQGGRIERRVKLPFTLKRPEDDPTVRAKMEEEIRREAEARVAAHFGDATKKPPKKVTISWTLNSPLFASAAARDRDLVLTLATADPHEGTIVLLRDMDESAACFEFPMAPLTENWKEVGRAVTDDAVWFAQPFGYVRWEDLDALLEEKGRWTPTPHR